MKFMFQMKKPIMVDICLISRVFYQRHIVEDYPRSFRIPENLRVVALHALKQQPLHDDWQRSSIQRGAFRSTAPPATLPRPIESLEERLFSGSRGGE